MCWACTERHGRRVAVATVLLLLAACGGDPASHEQRIRDAIVAVEQAIEDEDVGAVAPRLHDDYRDRLSPRKRDALATLRLYLRRHRDIHLFTVIRSVEVDPAQRQADSVVLVAMAGVPVTSLDVLRRINADLFRFEVDWRLEDGVWQAVESRWRRVGLAEF